MKQQFNALNLPADNSGCGTYRMTFPELALKTHVKDIVFTTTLRPITDTNFFRNTRVVRIQRQVTNEQTRYVMSYLKPMSQQIGFSLCYEIDDVLTYKDIPEYNKGKEVYSNPEFFSNIKTMLHAVDMITVTTEPLKEHYVREYDLDANKVIVIPNYVPSYWADYYDANKVSRNFDKNKNRPKILLPMPFSHFDSEGKGVEDDLTHIVDYIKKSVNKYEFVFMSYVPDELKELASQKKITVLPPSTILQYPKTVSELGINAIVAPLQDNEFNRCKSNIKQLEGWAQGIPVICQNLSCYSPYSDMLFDTAEDLDTQLTNLFSDKQKYLKTVKQNYLFMKNGKPNVPNFERGGFLEKNLQQWYDIYALPQRTIELDIRDKEQA